MTDLVVDDLSLSIRRSSRRKTIEITVDRDGSLLIAAPMSVETETLRQFVEDKRFWIYKKLAEKAEKQRVVPRKQYVSGEGFLYLGRSYRLKLVDGQEAPLKLSDGFFCLSKSAVPRAREYFIRWYSEHGRIWLSGMVREYAIRMEVSPGDVKVQDLGYRWGSCGKGNRLYFNWKTMLLPRLIAEYVVVHELVHLHEAHHAPAFWRRLERVLPDYERRKQWLAQNGISVEM